MNKIGYWLCILLFFLYPLHSISKVINYTNPHWVTSIKTNNFLFQKDSNSNYLNKIAINDYLLACIEKGDYQLVSYLLRRGADPNFYYSDEYSENYSHSALMVAAARGLFNISALLIKKGANVNYQSLDGRTALLEAIKYGNYRIVELLIKQGANVNFIAEFGDAALFDAVIFLRDSITDLLLKNKALVNITSASNLSPLQYSTGYSLLYLEFDGEKHLNLDTFIYHSNANRISELLISAGADINITDSYGYTPLMVAAQQNNIPLVKLLCKAGANINALSNDGISSLMFAADNGNYEIVKTLIKYGANVNYKPIDGNSALLAAVRANNDSIAEVLIQNNAFVNEKNSIGLSPLHYASGYGYPYMSNLLIKHGADINSTDLNRNTPLMTSVYSGAKEVTQILIDSGADVNFTDNKGNTPLMIAVQFNDTVLLRKLYNAGADIDRINQNKISALSIAIENNSVDAFKMLIDLGAKTDSSAIQKSYYQQAAEKDNNDISEYLVGKGLKTRLKPNISGIDIYTGFSSSQSDFMVDMGAGVYEPLTHLLINIGYKYRPFASRVLEYRNSTFYQFWEKRYSIYLSLQHFFILKRNFIKGNFGFIPGLNNEFSWHYYRGLNESSGLRWIPVPSVGLFYQKNLFTIIGKWEIAKYNSQITASNRFNIQLLMTIPTRKRVAIKKINWLD